MKCYRIFCPHEGLFSPVFLLCAAKPGQEDLPSLRWQPADIRFCYRHMTRAKPANILPPRRWRGVNEYLQGKGHPAFDPSKTQIKFQLDPNTYRE